MFPFFSYTHHRSFSLFSLFVLSLLPCFPANRLIPDFTPDNTWHPFTRLLDAGKSTTRLDGMSSLKSYFRRFGYLPTPPENATFSDFFDDEFESALISYQKSLGLSETGKLDHDTMSLIVTPRCGVADSMDNHRRVRATRRFAYFYGEPRWGARRGKLTYAFSEKNGIDYVKAEEVRAAFAAAFGRWSAVIPVNFTEASEYSSADIRIGWYGGDHGDGEAFDGVLGVLAHAFSPENGRLHLDAAERWAVDFTAEKSKVAVDLESVATHEIGHILGMAHSSVKESIMYPSLSPRTRKVELRMDDVTGIQALYGSNPNYKYDSRLESDLSSGRGMDLNRRNGLMKWWSVAVVFLVVVYFSLGL